MSYWYLLHSLVIESNQILPGLDSNRIEATASPDIRLYITDPNQPTGVPLPEQDWQLAEEGLEQNGYSFQAWFAPAENGYWLRLHYMNGDYQTTCTLAPDYRDIWATHSHQRNDLIALLLAGPLMSHLLPKHHRIGLHASVVATADHAFALVGHQGSGKSTTAAALTQAGCMLLADDIAVVMAKSDEWLVYPGTDYLRLHAESINALGYNDKLLPIGTRPAILSQEQWAGEVKYYFKAFSTPSRLIQPLPLAGIYLLTPRDPNSYRSCITTISPTEALLTLTQYVYGYQKREKVQSQAYFATLAQLARTVPVRVMNRPDRLDLLTEVSQLLLANMHATSNRAWES